MYACNIITGAAKKKLMLPKNFLFRFFETFCGQSSALLKNNLISSPNRVRYRGLAFVLLMAELFFFSAALVPVTGRGGAAEMATAVTSDKFPWIVIGKRARLNIIALFLSGPFCYRSICFLFLDDRLIGQNGKY